MPSYTGRQWAKWWSNRKLMAGEKKMISTLEWAKSQGIDVAENPSSLALSIEKYPRTAHEIAVRAIILQGVVAVAYGVEAQPVIEWFQQQHIWEAVSPQEQAFLFDKGDSEERLNKFQAHQEAEWALLWMIGKIDALGLPTHFCDTKKLVDEVIPALGSNILDFVSSAALWDNNLLLAEDLRTYNLWCFALRDRRENKTLPDDLNLMVLYERRYAFEWLDSLDEWDRIVCDA
jgi:hypothetical protein